MVKKLYEVLGLSNENATPADITKAYKKTIKKYSTIAGEVSMNKFDEVNQAHEILSNPSLRQVYDQAHASEESLKHFEEVLTQASFFLKKAKNPFQKKKEDQVMMMIDGGTEIGDSLSEATEETAEVVEKSQGFEHDPHALHPAFDSIKHAGGGASLAFNTFAVLIIGIQCIRENRWPSRSESRNIAYSLAIITLSALALSGVGGPVAVAALGAAAIFLAFGKKTFDVLREGYKARKAAKALEKRKEQQQSVIDEFEQTLKSLKTQTQTIQEKGGNKQLLEKLKDTREKLHTLEKQIQTNQKSLYSPLEKKSDAKVKTFGQKISKAMKRLLKIPSYFQNAFAKDLQKGSAKSALLYGIAIAMVIGGAMTLTPLAPIGTMILAACAIATAIVIGVPLIKKMLSRFFNKKHEANQTLQIEPTIIKPISVNDLPHAQPTVGLTSIMNNTSNKISSEKAPLAIIDEEGEEEEEGEDEGEGEGASLLKKSQ